MVFHGDKLRELRTKMHLSQEALATRIGVAKSAISQYECGKRTPEFAIAQKICMFFDCKLSDIADVPELIPFLGHDPFGMEKNRSQSNINIGTNNGAVSGSGNATVSTTLPSANDKYRQILKALFGHSAEAMEVLKNVTIDAKGEFANIDIHDKATLQMLADTMLNALKNAQARGDNKIIVPIG